MVRLATEARQAMGHRRSGRVRRRALRCCKGWSRRSHGWSIWAGQGQEEKFTFPPSPAAAPPQCASSFFVSPVGRVVAVAEEGSAEEGLAVEVSAAARFCRLICFCSQ
jgi:hypothetical protein